MSHSHDVLDVQVGLTTVVRVRGTLGRVVGSDDLLDGLVGDVVLSLELRKIVRRVRLAESLKDGLV